MDEQTSCPICEQCLTEGVVTTLGEKGISGIKIAVKKRGTHDLNIAEGAKIHRKCHQQFINPKYIEQYLKRKADSAKEPIESRHLRSGERFDTKNSCLFCNESIHTRQKETVYPVRTENQFFETIRNRCHERQDSWGQTVLGRLEYCRDLLAQEVKYHQNCSVSFRTKQTIPMIAGPSYSNETKRKKLGRPVRDEQASAFTKVLEYLEQCDDQHISISELVEEMSKQDCEPYSIKHMKAKLQSHYGETLFIAQHDGKPDVVTLINTASRIIHDFHENSRQSDIESEKINIISTAADLIIADIKAASQKSMNYPSPCSLSSLEENLKFVPDSLRLFLSSLFTSSKSDVKVASLGQALMQCTKPRTILAPLQLGVGVQMHHHTGSRFIVDELNHLGFSSSYAEVKSYERSAAITNSQEQLKPDRETFLQFVADNVDHNISTLDGFNTFHGMGMIAACTPMTNCTKEVPRKKYSRQEVIEAGKINIIFYKAPDTTPTPLIYKKLPQLEIVDHYTNVDLLWKTSWLLRPYRPSWTGFMQSVNKTDSSSKSSITFLPMIDLNPGDDSCIASTLYYLAEQAKKNNITAVVTFDQPLFWKATCIVNAETGDSPIKNVVLRLGGFHTLMSFMGSIGHIMGGSGLDQVLELIYAANSVPHILTGKAYSRAVRGHLLIESALHAVLLSREYKVTPACNDSLKESDIAAAASRQNDEIEPEQPEYPDEVSSAECLLGEMDSDQRNSRPLHEAATLIESLLSDHISLEDACSSASLLKIKDDLQCQKRSSSNNLTAQLWYTYLDMVELLRDFLRAERSGNWMFHLSTLVKMLPYFAAAGHNLYLKSVYIYVLSMLELETQQPHVYVSFMSGHHVLHRTDKCFSGLSTDLVIEQTLMRSVKSAGGLTRGRGMDEMQRAVWLLSMPVCAAINESISEFAGLKYETSEQHKDAAPSRIARDSQDVGKLYNFLHQRSPFEDGEELRNTCTGQIAENNVTSYKAKDIGTSIVDLLADQDAYTHTFKRKHQVTTMSTKNAIKINNEMIQIDPRLLFQRCLTAAAVNTDTKDAIFTHELCSYPPSLFEASGLPLVANKPSLTQSLRKMVATSPFPADSDHLPSSCVHATYVLDGGSLLHKIPWPRGSSYKDVIQLYKNYIGKRYGNATVVFDGYSSQPSIKDVTHLRRTAGTGNKILFELDYMLNTPKDLFLANKDNKERFISFLANSLQTCGNQVFIADGDADLLIVNTAIEKASSNDVVVIGEDTDLLVLLCYYVSPDNHDVFFKSDLKKHKSVWNIKIVKSILQNNTDGILFAHALLGCDSTSRLFGVGKGVSLKLLVDSSFKTLAETFNKRGSSQQDVTSAGEKALLYVYGCPNSPSLDKVRVQKFAEKTARASIFVEPQTLPPTSAAAKFHSLRVYVQVQTWLGQAGGLNPTDWGYQQKLGRFIPIMTDLPPAPEELLSVIACACKAGCNTVRCSCRKHGLKCSNACTGCKGNSCTNSEGIEME